MALNPIPPQAYTKETLQKAYGWLLRQSPEIKEMARDQEILVSLYLKAQRNGEDALDRPSIHNFRSELKNLADMMTDLNSSSVVESKPSFIQSKAHVTPAPTSLASAPSAIQRTAIEHTESLSNNFNSIETTPIPNPTLRPFNSNLLDVLDEKTMQYLKQTKERFNLSTESEALRLLVAAGMEKLK